MLKRVLFWGSMLLTGLAVAAQATTTVEQVNLDAAVAHCDHKVASIFVGQIQCKASSCSAAPAADDKMSRLMAMAAMANGQIQVDTTKLGEGTSAAVVSALRATGCFTVQERADIQALKEEAELAGMPFQPKSSDFLIAGTITSVDVSSSTKSFGGGFIPVVGAVSKTRVIAKLSLDMRIIDTKTTEVVDSKSFTGTSDTASWNSGGGTVYGGAGLFGVSTSTNSRELDGVANQIVIEAVNHLIQSMAKDAIESRPSAAAQ